MSYGVWSCDETAAPRFRRSKPLLLRLCDNGLRRVTRQTVEAQSGCIVTCNDSTSHDINWQNHADRRAFLELTFRLHAPALSLRDVFYIRDTEPCSVDFIGSACL